MNAGLGDLVLPGADSAAILDRFLGFVAERGIAPYPEQEEAILELLADRHVVLSTSGDWLRPLVTFLRRSRS